MRYCDDFVILAKTHPEAEAAMDISGLSSWTNPPGFHEAAVASSATAMKALATPAALAPEPTGVGEEDMTTGVSDCAQSGSAVRPIRRSRARENSSLPGFHEFLPCLAFRDDIEFS